MAARSITTGTLKPEIDDKLPIVKADAEVWKVGATAPDKLAFVRNIVPNDFFYHSKISIFKCGFVEDPHMTVKYRMFPSCFTKEAYEDAIAEIIQRYGTIEGYTVQEAIAWSPPPSSIEKGELNYRCVVLKLESSGDTKLARLREDIGALSSCIDRFGANPVAHMTVAYICSPDNNEQATVLMANQLVSALNKDLCGATVRLTNLRLDHNGFPYYGTNMDLEMCMMD